MIVFCFISQLSYLFSICYFFIYCFEIVPTSNDRTLSDVADPQLPVPELENATLEAEAHTLVYTVESLLTSSSKLKEYILLNDTSTLVASIVDEKRQLQDLTNKSRLILAETGQTLTEVLDKLKHQTLSIQPG